ncbi:glutamyl endopeptidase [Fusarium sporotrichioides]|uniref:Serine protease n=1 Tax=Fusarium sporotrichioides TaxID=5514 RepID=A0A395RGH4_FUSSP|nr:glutamyl endopeptidase [Fusarium sporotrichioides]
MSSTSSKPGRAAVWKLVPPTTNHPAESTIIPDDGSKGDSESIIGEDQRALVDFSDFLEGGKYRSRFEGKGKPVWMMGTGWLIRPDVLVTAGHVVYDWGRRYGAASQIRCFIGYNGRASLQTAQVQARYGVKVISTEEWLQDAGNRTRDLAFIQVDRAFTGNLRTFNYVNTPPSGHKTLLGVVGYPGDKSLKDPETGDEEKGAQMYEEYAKNDYDVGESARHMVEYQISTFGGQSGAPILRRANGQLVSIGTHCYGGGGTDSNSGNAIGGPYGNDYEAFVRLFSIPSTFGDIGSVRVVETKAQTVTIQPAINKSVSYPTNGVNGRSTQNKTIKPQYSESDEEGFLDVFKTIANVGSKIIPLASPFLGPVGGILGPAVGGLLGSLAESELSDNPDIKTEGTAERALLAEAALQAILASEHTEGLTEVVGKMQRIWKVDAPKVDYLAPVIAPIVAECGQSFIRERQHPVQGRTVKNSISQSRRSLGIDMSESTFGGEEAAFVQGLMGPTRQVAGEEGMFDWLGPVLKQGAVLAKPLVSQAASAALSGLGGLIKKSLGAESTIADVSPEHEEATKILLKRAVMADTALQALMTLPSDKLEQLKPINPETGEAEGIFDSIKDTVQKLGPIALDTAKQAAKTYLPRLIDSATQKVSSRLGLPTESSGPTRTLSKKPSLMDTLNGKNNAIKVRHVSHSADGLAIIDITPMIRHREETWVPSEEWQKCWDDNDDGPVLMKQPPPDL